MQLRPFGRGDARGLPGPHAGVHGVMIQVDGRRFPPARLAALGRPFALETPVQVEAMDFDPHARIDAHSAPNDILFLVTGGAGRVPVGEQTRTVAAGDAVLWPAAVEHTAWTEGEALQAIVVNLPPAR